MKWRIGFMLVAALIMAVLIGFLSSIVIHNILVRLFFNFVTGGILGIGVAKKVTGASWGEIREVWRFKRRK